MAVHFNLGPCSICQKAAAEMGVGARACPSCRSVFLDLCAPCAGKRCPKCTKGKLAERDSVFPYSLFRAISEEDDYKINSLLNRTREALDEITDQQGETPLAVAARGESSIAAERLCKLLMERGASADARLKSGRTALMEMIRYRGNYYSKVAALLRGSVNAQDNAGMTALMFAVEGAGVFGSRRGNMTAIRDLISLGADPSLKDGRGLTALGHAIASNDTEMNQPAIDYLKEQMVQRVALREFDRRRFATTAVYHQVCLAGPQSQPVSSLFETAVKAHSAVRHPRVGPSRRFALSTASPASSRLKPLPAADVAR